MRALYVSSMILNDGRNPEELFHQFVLGWFELIANGQWAEAFAQLDLGPNYGEPYTPETYRNEIENDHFCEVTVYRQQFQEIVYSNPKEMSGHGSPNLYQIEGTSDFEFELDIPLNMEWSDLTSGWQFIDSGAFYKVRLDWLNVL